MLAAVHVPGCPRGSDRPPVPPRPNVLLITLDTTRADHLGCYGYGPPTTPHLDALAADGIRFDMAIATAASTPVSHASILTGLNPYHHGVRVICAAGGYRLPESVPTLATCLRARGWRTAAFLSSFTVSEHYGLHQGFDHFDNGLERSPDHVLVDRAERGWVWDTRANQRRSDETTDRAIAWLHDHRGRFFLWVHYWDAHDLDLIPPREINARFVPPLGSGEAARTRGLYDAEVFYVDSQIGRLLQTLKHAGEYDNTIIVVVADHGQGLGDHDWWYHRLVYQEQVRVPLIMRLPSGPAGRVVPDLVRTTDICPTVLELSGLTTATRVDGRSLRGLIRGERDAPRVAYAEALILLDLNAARNLKLRPGDDLLYCLMDRAWKLIYKPRRADESELYNLAADPGEMKNLYHQRPEHARRLRAELERRGPFVDEPFGEGRDQEVLDRLRSLGYVGESDP